VSGRVSAGRCASVCASAGTMSAPSSRSLPLCSVTRMPREQPRSPRSRCGCPTGARASPSLMRTTGRSQRHVTRTRRAPRPRPRPRVAFLTRASERAFWKNRARGRSRARSLRALAPECSRSPPECSRNHRSP